MADNPKIKQITIPGSNNVYDLVDQGARDLISALNSFTYAICTEAANTPSGVSFTSGNATITGTLTAAATTMNRIYLVPVTRENKTIYNEYITVDKGSGTPQYVWEMFGDTDIHLSDFGNLAYKDTASGTLPKIKVTDVALNTTSKYLPTSATSGGSVTNGTAASCTLPTWSASVQNEVLAISWNSGSWTANTPTAVTLPNFTSQTVGSGTVKTQPTASYDSTNSTTTITVS